MRCANCNCEIGNLTQCPYCGHKNRYVYRAQEAGQYGTVGQNAPTRSVQADYSQQHRPDAYATRTKRSQNPYYTQSAPTRAVPSEQRSMRRVPREITNIELLLRLILLMQCVIALLLTVELVISSMGV